MTNQSKNQNDKETPVNGWTSWGNYVLKELERLNTCFLELDKALRSIDREITILQVKAGIWGLIAGMIPVFIALIILFATGRFGD